jgi:hypothetical protein
MFVSCTWPRRCPVVKAGDSCACIGKFSGGANIVMDATGVLIEAEFREPWVNVHDFGLCRLISFGIMHIYGPLIIYIYGRA